MSKFVDTFNVITGLGVRHTLHRPRDDPPHSWFEAVHDPAYYRAFLAGELGEKAERRIGFGGEMQKPGLIQRTVLECSGTVLTAELALRHGLAANVAGGTHHAHRDFGSGFTILNDLAVAAQWARDHANVQRVAVVDLDVHQGDGTAALFHSDPDVFTFSMHCGANFPFRKSPSDWDVDVPRGTADGAYMALLREALPTILADFQPDLVLYDAGVDVYAGDALGHLDVTHAGLWRRDTYVMETCVRAGVPIGCVIGGGYDKSPLALARRHALVHRAAALVWERHGLG